jgi:hypothetical protein
MEGLDKDIHSAEDLTGTKETLFADEISYPDGGLRAWLIVLGVRITANV